MADVFVVSMLHFNLQYCAGGYEGLFADWPSDNESIEDQIVVESFEPVLDMLLEHPTWGMDLELQGYMVDVLAERHPDVLDKLRTLNESGQVELISFHWSDQLWLAYPPLDQERSLELTAATFEEHGLVLSDVVFTQEGQFGVGMLREMPEHGYRVALMPHNLGEYWWGYEPDRTLYAYGDDVLVLPGGSSLTSADGSYQVQWSFFDDGELLATGDVTPYLGPAFVEDPEAVAAFVADMEAREAAGAKISTIGDYVAAVESRGTEPLPPVLDGTWQPGETTNLGLWMGGSGLWGQDERDNEVRTTVMTARHAVAAAEALAEGDPELQPTVEEAWKEVLLAEVSDATGWNPYPTEVQYARDHAASAVALAQEIAQAGCEANGTSSVVVDLATGGVAWGYAEGELATTPIEPTDLDVTVGERDASVAWSVVEGIDDVLHVDVTFPMGEGAPSVGFAWDGLVVATTPAMLDEVVAVDAADVAAEEFGLALPNGLVRLSEDVWLIKRTDSVHLAGVFSKSAGTVRFEDHTLPAAQEATWRFLVVLGDEARALEVARDANVTPWVSFQCDAVDTDEGCGCASSPGAGWAWLLAVAAIWRRRCSR
jgi:MYXO-CTERM domain-containing protein